MPVETWRTPTLQECSGCGVEPTEFQILVSMSEKAEKTAGGILLPEATKDKAQWGSDHARLVAVSPHAFTYVQTWPEGSRKPQVGDVVFVGKFPGDEITGRDGRTYRLCSDKEVLAVMERVQETENA